MSNSYDRLADALHTGPKTSSELRKLVGAGVHTRITEWNRAVSDVRIVRIGKYYQFVRVKNIKLKHKTMYPEYYLSGKYEWPAKQRKNAA